MSTWAEQDIRLDPSIRNWVLLPITIVMLLVGILRHYAIQLLNTPSSSKSTTKPLSKNPILTNIGDSNRDLIKKKKFEGTTSGLRKLREQRLLIRSNIFRTNSNFLNFERFRSRREILISALEGDDYLSESFNKKNSNDNLGNDGNDGQDGVELPNPMDLSQMDGMMDGLKKQMVMMVPQTVIMGWINTFFYGFVCVKLPFPLPNGFKQMIQRGIETPDMDISWVSSLSWYFLNLFGLNPIYRLILGDGNAADGSSALSMGSNTIGLQQNSIPGQKLDQKKIFRSEIENLKLLEFNNFFDKVISSSNLKNDNNSNNNNSLSYEFIFNYRNFNEVKKKKKDDDDDDDDENFIGEDIESRIILLYSFKK